jgi:hypothetical protein
MDYAFSEGLVRVEIDGKHGYIDTTGRIVIKPQFDAASHFWQGLALVEVDKGYGYIDTAGQYIWNPTA